MKPSKQAPPISLKNASVVEVVSQTIMASGITSEAAYTRRDALQSQALKDGHDLTELRYAVDFNIAPEGENAGEEA